jgi:hypothetical protein
MQYIWSIWDALSLLRLNFVLERAIKKDQANYEGVELNDPCQLLSYSTNINVLCEIWKQRSFLRRHERDLFKIKCGEN